MKQTFTKTLLLILLPVLWGACSSDDNNDPTGGSGNGELKISIDAPNNEVSGNGASFFLKIETNGEWTVSAADSWCTFFKQSGKGTSSIICTAQPNTTGRQRSTTISVTVGKEQQELTVTQKAGGDDPEPEKPNGYAGRIEVPALKGGDMNLFITHTTQESGKEVITYSYEYDCTKLHSRWVAFTFSTATPNNNVGRDDNFRPDPKLPTAYQLTTSDYTGTGYSRGHLVASGDRQYSKEANKLTFYMSNMSPQIQNGFNGGIWANLEGKVQSWGQISNPQDTLYVAKGGTINDDQIIEYVSGNNKSHQIPVPKYYFMAILSLKNGVYKAIGFWLEHKPYSNNNGYADNAVSIDVLEQKTGIDFFHNLPDNIENEVEASFSKNDWGL